MNIEAMRAVEAEAAHWGKEHYPNASEQQHNAFTNSVVYALFAMTGPCGGPSLREHVASALLNGALIDWREAPRERVYTFLASPCYGALTEEHLRFWLKFRDICHDDDPDDVRTLEAHAERFKFATTRVWSSTLENMRRVAALRNEAIVEAWDRLAREELARLTAACTYNQRG